MTVTGCSAVGSAFGWGPRGRRFKSCHPDQVKYLHMRILLYSRTVKYVHKGLFFIRTILIWISSIITIGATIPYLIDIVRGRSKPNIVSWFTWTLLTGIGTAIAVTQHQYATAALIGSAGIATVLVVILGLRYGIAKYSILDGVCQVAALIGLMLWYIFNSPTIAIIAVVLIDFIAAVPTYRHSWIEPEEETQSTYVFESIASVLTLFALSSYSIVSVLYPAYLLFSNTLIVTIIQIKFWFLRNRAAVDSKVQ